MKHHLQRTYLLVCGASLSCLLCCHHAPAPAPTSGEGDDARASQYTEGLAMSHHRNDPERTMLLIDSGVIAGNITPERAKYLKAVTIYSSSENRSLPRQMCLEIIDDMQSHALPLDNEDAERNVYDVYSLLTIIEYSSGNNPAVIRYATEASRRAHQLNMPAEVAKMEGYIAQAMAQTGRTDEGVERLRNTIAQLRETDTFGAVNAYHNISKKLLHILLENERYGEMVPVCESILNRIDYLALHPERFTDMAEGFDPGEFIDFARGQANAFLTVAYARQYEATKTPPTEMTPAARAQLLKKARQAEAAVHTTKWSHSLDCDRMMTAAYPYIGDYQRFDEAMKRLDATHQDTINANYYICLTLKSLAAEMQGQLPQALHYLQRASIVRDSLDTNNQRDQINELATLYHLQEEQLARQQAEADARLYRWLSIAIIVILLLAVGFALYFFHKRRETMQKNKALVRMIDEMHDQNSLANSPSPTREGSIYTQGGEATEVVTTPLSSRRGDGGEAAEFSLFQRFTALVHDEKLYRDVSLDRDAVCQRLGIDRHVLNDLMNSYADGLSLPAYINNVRLDVAYKLLRDQPAKSIAEIATDVGFTPQNLRLQFKRRYGITPTEYRQSRL